MHERGSNSAQPHSKEEITTYTPATHYLPKDIPSTHTTISTTAPCDSRLGLRKGGQRKNIKGGPSPLCL